MTPGTGAVTDAAWRSRLGRSCLEGEFEHLQLGVTTTESERLVQRGRGEVVGGGVDECGVDAVPSHPGEGVGDERTTESLSLVGGIDRDALEISAGPGATADREAGKRAPCGDHAAPLVGSGRADLVE